MQLVQESSFAIFLVTDSLLHEFRYACVMAASQLLGHKTFLILHSLAPLKGHCSILRKTRTRSFLLITLTKYIREALGKIY